MSFCLDLLSHSNQEKTSQNEDLINKHDKASNWSMAVISPDIILLIAKHAETSTLKSLRLASRTIASLISRTFAAKAFPYLNIQITEAGLTRLEDMCTSAMIAPYIQNIGINTQAPRHTTIYELRRALRKSPPMDPQGVVRDIVESLLSALYEYELLCSRGGIIDRLQSAFENLRRNRNTELILEIWDDGDGSCVGYKNEFDILWTMDGTTDPDGILDRGGMFCFDQFNQSRVLLALSRSGLSLKQLRVTSKAHLLAHPWDNVYNDLTLRDDMTSSYQCDDLSQIDVKEIHVVITLDCESWKQEPGFMLHRNSALHRLVANARSAKSFILEGQCRPAEFDAGPLLSSLALSRWSSVCLESLSIRASSLFQLRAEIGTSIKNLELRNVKWIQDTDQNHVDCFVGS
ncbi:hypothetical protein M436DRAFT_68365 [Aureobasidium namibiae CBS 147.97]|uniref:Uncharacterized protein n=1 Tax=Aureobasidium namibiae CBS 147.97 TaxID=1043004 RepID=A0A074W5S1_9PEZI|nr:uncharacterized protein M436DRAFT_68365 [Aureobasidium namibiae CBS 147.97]KEQ68198.1 hypothetical protein M436DRAFT_68365 [Aureobasidium namibiae CBS 147.97]